MLKVKVKKTENQTEIPCKKCSISSNIRSSPNLESNEADYYCPLPRYSCIQGEVVDA